MKKIKDISKKILVYLLVFSMLFGSAGLQIGATDDIMTTSETEQKEPKAEETKQEEPKAEEPKAQESKVEEPKTEESKTEEPKAEEPKTEEPKTEEPKTEEPQAEEPKAEEKKSEETKEEKELPSTFVYEDNDKKVTAVISDPKALPEGAVFVVKDLTDKEYKESKALIIEQLYPKANKQELAMIEESMKDLVLYDMHFEVDKTEVEPVNAKISVEITNKKIVAPKSVDSEDKDVEYKAVHLKETDSEVKVEDVTKEIEMNQDNAVEAIQLETDSFSIVGYYPNNSRSLDTRTIFDYNGDYSLYYILNNFNVFIENDFTSNNHIVGPAAVGGSGTINHLGGTSVLTTPPYVHNIPSYIKGAKAQVQSYAGKSLLFAGSNTDTSGSSVQFTKNDVYIDFAEAFSQIRSAASSYTEANVTIDMAKVEQVRKAGWSGSGYKDPNGYYELKYSDRGVMLTIDASRGTSYKISSFKNIGIINFKVDTNTKAVTNTMILYDGAKDSGQAIKMPITYFNGNTVVAAEVLENTGIVYLFPSYKGNMTVEQTWIGHIVAPDAKVNMKRGNFNGCIIAKNGQADGSEGHMWPYNGSFIKPTTGDFKVYKTVDGATPSTDQTFTFKLEQIGDIPTGSTKLETKTAYNVKGAVNFGSINYSAEGNYYYRITEESKAGYKVNNQSFIVKVVVTKAESNGVTTYSRGITYYKGKEVSDATDSNKVAGASVTFENETEKKEGKAIVTAKKTLSGAALTADQFEFSLTPVGAKDGNNQDITDPNQIQKKTNSAPDANGVGTITFNTLKYTQAGTYQYELKETSIGGNGITADKAVYTVTVTVTDSGTGNLETSVTVTDKDNKEVAGGVPVFKNTYNAKGEAIVTAGKTLLGATLKADQFEFSLTPVSAKDGNNQDITDPNQIQKKTNGAPDENGVGTITFDTLKYTQAGIYQYELKETSTDSDGITTDQTVYTVTVTVTDSGSGNLETSVTVTDKDNKKVDDGVPVFKNTYSAKGEVTFGGTKALSGRDFAEEDEFAFNLYKGTKEGETVTYEETPMATKSASGTVGADDWEFQFDQIEYTEAGTYYYKVTEEHGGNSIGQITYDDTVYEIVVTVTDKVKNGKLTVDYKITKGTEEVKTLAFTNTYHKVDAVIKGKKTVEGTSLTEGLFRFELLDAAGNVIDTAKNAADGTFEFDAIEYTKAGDYGYTIREINGGKVIGGVKYDDSVKSATVTVSENENGVLTASASTDAEPVSFTNKAVTSIQVEKQWANDSEVIKERPDTVTVHLLTNGKATDKAIKLSAANQWKDEFTDLPVKDGDGNPYIYTIHEDEVPGYQVDVETIEGGFRLTNTYTRVKHVEVKLEAQKLLEGRGLQVGEFSFNLYDQDGNIMETETNTESGSILFSNLVYEKAGTYHYTIRENVGNTNHIVYDKQEIKVTVNVVDQDGVLTATTTYAKNGITVGRAEFTNRYYPISIRLQKRSKDLTRDPLEGARYGLYRVNEAGRDIFVESQLSDANGYMYFTNITPGYRYYFKEISAPDGHTVDEYRSNIFEVFWNQGATDLAECVKIVYYDNDGQVTSTENYSAEVKLSTNTRETTEAEMKTADYTFENDTLIAAAWVSDQDAFPAGSKLNVEILEEGTAKYAEAQGKIQSEIGETKGLACYDVHFENAEGEEIEPAKGTVKVVFKYKNALDMGEKDNTQYRFIHIKDNDEVEPLSGSVYKNQEEKVTESSFVTGSFSIIALAAQNGTDNGFTLAAEGVADNVVSLSVAKIDKRSGAYLEGAHLQIIDEATGKVMCDWISTKNNFLTERELNVDTIYILREVKAPEGYGLAEDTRFTMDIYGNMKIISGPDAEWNDDKLLTIYNEPEPITKVVQKRIKKTIRRGIKTGDNAPIEILLLLCGVSAVAVGAIFWKKKRTR